MKKLLDRFLKIRDQPSPLGAWILGTICVLLVLMLWWLLTYGDKPETRIISPVTLGSPAEVFGTFKSLWFDRALTRSIFASLRRVIIGFALAAAVGIPLGILSGAFFRFRAFLNPVVVFGRNIPIAALIPLTILWFGTGESQKIMFIFIACVAFIIFDVMQAVNGISDRYLDTAYTLGASRFQIIMKVIVPLSMPDIFNSLRLLFGLAFGYILLAELIDAKHGLGYIIQLSQRRGPREHIILVLFIITILAYIIDRALFLSQKYLFPYKFKNQH